MNTNITRFQGLGEIVRQWAGESSLVVAQLRTDEGRRIEVRTPYLFSTVQLFEKALFFVETAGPSDHSMEPELDAEMRDDFADFYGVQRGFDNRVAVLVDGTLIDPSIPDHIGAALRSQSAERRGVSDPSPEFVAALDDVERFGREETVRARAEGERSEVETLDPFKVPRGWETHSSSGLETNPIASAAGSSMSRSA